MIFFKKRQGLIIILAIVAMAAFLRFWQIDKIPPGLYPDEAMNGNNALQVLETAPPASGFKIFYPENNGREGLFINIQAISLKIFGPKVWALRIVSAFFGTLTILGLYLLAKELFGKKPAYFAAFFAAVSFWHVNFSRIGFRAIMVPFCIVFSFYFLFKALRTSKTGDYILAGLFLGLGLHTYLAFRFAPILAVFVLGICLWGWRRNFFIKKELWKWLVFVGAAIIVFLPLGIYFLAHPQDFFGRAGEVSVFNSNHLWQALIVSTFKSWQKFFVFGDYNWRHNLSGAPELLWPVGLLFLIGIIVSVKEIIIRGSKALGHWFLILGFVLLSLPEILTSEGLPHALRSIGSIPFVFIFSGLGARSILADIHYIRDIISFARKSKMNFCFLAHFDYKNNTHKATAVLIIGAILAGIGFLGFFQYFYLWDNRLEVQDAFSQEFVNIGDYLNELPSSVNKIVIVNADGILVNGLPVPAQTVKFITYGKSEVSYLTKETVTAETVGNACHGGGVLIPMAYDANLWNKLASLLPDQFQIKKIENFWVFQCK